MSNFVKLPGSRRIPLPGSRLAGPIDPEEVATLTIRVRSRRDPAALEKWVQEQSAKPLAERKYLTRKELADSDGADPADLDNIESYAAKHNLVVINRSTPQRSILLRGKLGDLLDAFPASLRIYHHDRGTYRGRSGEIQIPPQFQSVITGIFGFDTRRKKRASFGTRVSRSGGPGGQNGQPSTFYARRYNFPQNYQGVNLDGTGQTIAIIELGGGYRTSDLQAYFQEIASPNPSVSMVSVNGATNLPSNPKSPDGEVMLDIEVAGAVAPKANIVVYFAPNEGDAGFVNAISSAIHDTERSVDVISISWGNPEPKSTDAQELQAYHELFVAASSLGITVCVSSGDHGVADLDAADWDGLIHVDHPAVDPYVLACGGTQIDSSNSDVVWNDGMPFDVSSIDGGGWAGGGGISKCYPVPDYQKAANVPLSLDGGTAGRGVPDVAMSATGYFVRVDSAEYSSGGTSAVAPLMAALVVLLNQAKKKNVGFLNPFLYSKTTAGIARDVTTGGNSITGTVNGYNAGPGWDACTGLGTPDGGAILNAL